MSVLFMTTLVCSVESCSAVYLVYGPVTQEEFAEPLCPRHQKARLVEPESDSDEAGAERN